MSLRALVKRAGERVIRLVAGHPRRMAGRSLVLAYHNVVADEDAGHGDASLHLRLSDFRRQVDLLQRYCHVRPLLELLERDHTEDDRPSIAITFDDAYHGAVTNALPLLDQRGLASTLFVAPGLLGAASLWWDELAVDGEGLSDGVREPALHQEAGVGQRIQKRFGQSAVKLPESYRCATEAEVLQLARLRTVVLGAHSWNHPNLSALGAAELADEMARPLAWCSAQCVPSIPVVAYPYGLCSPAVEQAAAAAGFTAGLLVDGGWLQAERRGRLGMPRYNIPAGLSEDGFMLRLSGALAL